MSSGLTSRHQCINSLMREDDSDTSADVAAAVEGSPANPRCQPQDLINEALRRGIQEMKRSTKRREHFSTQAVALGRLRIGSLNKHLRSPRYRRERGLQVISIDANRLFCSMAM
jgi:hypothetical protein